MKLRPRLVPSVILAATILLGLKVSDIFSVGSHALAQAISANQATGAPIDLTSLANAAKAPEPIPAAEKPQDTTAEKPASSSPPPQQATATPPTAPPPPAAAPATTPPPAPAAAAQSQAATPQKQAAPAPAPAQPGDSAKSAPPAEDAKPAPQTAEAPASIAPPAPAEAKPAIKDPLLLSPAEIEVLQELSLRRAQLDRRAGEIDQQQIVLQAAEKRIDDKIAKLEAIQKSVQAIVDKQNAADDARTQSLVKIYETMKPADAAQILSQLDMPILLQMLSRMKEAKTAPILAAMDPTKAEAITTAMAKRQNPPAAPPAPAAAPAKP